MCHSRGANNHHSSHLPCNVRQWPSDHDGEQQHANDTDKGINSGYVPKEKMMGSLKTRGIQREGVSDIQNSISKEHFQPRIYLYLDRNVVFVIK